MTAASFGGGGGLTVSVAGATYEAEVHAGQFA